MPMGNDPEYYAARLRAERAAAAATNCAAARASHLALAEQYEQLLAAFGRPRLVSPNSAEASAGA